MILIIPRAQPLRFVEITSYPPTFYTHDNTLLQDEGRFYDEPVVYFQKYNTADPIKFQVITDYTNIVATLYNSANASQGTITLSDLNAPLTTAKYLEGSINTSAMGGIYYVKIVATGVGVTTFTYQSEYFEVNDFSDYPYLTWKNSDYAGLYYATGTIFGMRIEADITPYKAGENTDSFEAYNSILVNVKTTTKRNIVFATDEIPRYMYEKLVLAFAHKNVYINGIEYVAAEASSSEQIPSTQFYFFTKTLTEVNYEIYDTLEESSGGSVPTPGTDTFILDSVLNNKWISSTGNYVIPY